MSGASKVLLRRSLNTELHRVREIGATADGAVGDPDPMMAGGWPAVYDCK